MEGGAEKQFEVVGGEERLHRRGGGGRGGSDRERGGEKRGESDRVMEVEEKEEEEDYGCSSAQLSSPPLREDRRDPSAHHWRFIDFYPACSLSKIRYGASPLDLLTF